MKQIEETFLIDTFDIRIQVIGMEGFTPKMNCKFSFCLAE